jgi:NitT/TauT family transport system substrate-binding protein
MRHQSFRTTLSAAMVLGVVSVGVNHADADGIEQKRVVIAVGGVTSQMDKLPYAVAVHRGYFREEGLDVESVDFNSGAKGLEAMVGGSADVTQGAFEHIPELQAKGVNLISFALFSRYPGDVLVIAKKRAAEIRSPADLKGRTIGISSPGSATQAFLGLVLRRAGMNLECCSYVAVGNGAGAVASMRSGNLDALVNLDPNITELQLNGDVVVMADSRTAEGTREYYGGDYIVGSLYAKSEWVAKHPNTVQALANGIAHAMQWLRTTPLDGIVDGMPPEYYQSSREHYRKVVENNLTAFQWDGIATPAAAKNTVNALAVLEPELATAPIDLAKTYTNEFMIRANQKFP